MDGNGRMKFNGISQLVKLKEALQHLHAIAARQKKKAVATNESESKNVNENENENENENQNHQQMLSVVINKRLAGYLCCDSDEESSCQSPEHPADVPKGFLAVYVGEGEGPELRRFIIPTSYLSHTVFKVLLEKAEEEFGFDHCGGLTLPCETETFKYLLKCMEQQPMPLPAETNPAAGTSLTMEG
ncbi:auxin-responsive protein SAUR61 [Momordica charantia]|uniref:Auxin-responsive protein SAUR61 n=1 Tax=Momordica charantia TaxID=3673 RepID=A0A6J1D2J9_MOMCH|nr:auxin-responsive protein SAUR61 [Momordica charantia]XP_022148310.1 auxin-responsive protein SAUR61 [Momordica charantia]XP_022148311.1 auxin-responsive protein SAUR61 [Momordica charantia]